MLMNFFLFASSDSRKFEVETLFEQVLNNIYAFLGSSVEQKGTAKIECKLIFCCFYSTEMRKYAYLGLKKLETRF